MIGGGALSTQETPFGEGPEEQHPPLGAEAGAGARSSGADPDTYISYYYYYYRTHHYRCKFTKTTKQSYTN